MLDAFGSVHDILHQVEVKHEELSSTIESLPIKSKAKEHADPTEQEGPFCFDQDLLMLKATSKASVTCLEQALTMLQDIRELNYGPLALDNQPSVVVKTPFAFPSSSPLKSVNALFNPSVQNMSPVKAKKPFSNPAEDSKSSSTFSLPGDIKDN